MMHPLSLPPRSLDCLKKFKQMQWKSVVATAYVYPSAVVAAGFRLAALTEFHRGDDDVTWTLAVVVLWNLAEATAAVLIYAAPSAPSACASSQNPSPACRKHCRMEKRACECACPHLRLLGSHISRDARPARAIER